MKKVVYNKDKIKKKKRGKDYEQDDYERKIG